MELRLGQLVISRAGRDRGRRYLITRILGPRFVEVSDGQARMVSKPKKKNVNHLIVSRKVAGTVEVKLSAGMEVTDEEVREALKALEEDKSKGVM